MFMLSLMLACDLFEWKRMCACFFILYFRWRSNYQEGRIGTALPGKRPPHHCAWHRFVDFCDIAGHHCLNVFTDSRIFNWQTAGFQQPYIRPFDCKIKNDSLFQQKEQTIFFTYCKWNIADDCTVFLLFFSWGLVY